MLRTRALVAVIVLPLLFGLVAIGGWPFALFLLAMLLGGGVEFQRLLWKNGYHPPLGLISAAIGLSMAMTWFDRVDWQAPGLAGLLIAAGAYAIWSMERHQPYPIFDTALAVFGGLYIGWLGSYVLAIRMLDDGALLTIFLYSSVAITDSAAYLIGKPWGTHHMSPRVSPNKTWEGYIASVISGGLFGGLIGALQIVDVLTVAHGAIIGLLIGTLGTIGDLAISALKRQVGVKDSSNLIPGHGGILDRIDSVLVAAAINYYYLLWFVVK